MNMPYKVYNSMKSGLCLYSDCEQLQHFKGPLTERLPVILRSSIMFVVLGCRMKFTCSVTFFSVQFSLQLHVLCSSPPPPPPPNCKTSCNCIYPRTKVSTCQQPFIHRDRTLVRTRDQLTSKRLTTFIASFATW